MKLLKTEDGKYLLWVDENTGMYSTQLFQGDHYWDEAEKAINIVPPDFNEYKSYRWKIAAHLPLTPDAAPLEGVPLLPPLSVQGYPEQEPMDYYPPKDLANAIWGNCFDYKNVDTEYEGEAIKNRVRGACFAAERYFYFQAASQDRKYSAEDLRKAFEWGIKYKCALDSPHKAMKGTRFEDLVKSLSPATPLPTEFVPEMQIVDNTREWTAFSNPLINLKEQYKTITLPEGQKQVMGTYKL